MNETESADWGHAAMLDARGLQCPLPVLKARKALLGLRRGERLLIEATDPVAAIDFPHYCSESGHRLVASATDGGILRFLIEKA
jgi:tRNA 2-thiouridine synthesizing protein A